MGDRKPKKNSSGNSDLHKAKQAKHLRDRPPIAPREHSKGKSGKK